MAPEDFTLQLQYAGAVGRGAWAKRVCQCLHSGPEKTLILTWTDPTCVIVSYCLSRMWDAQKNILPLFPLPSAFFLSSEWNKAQLFTDCLGGKSETDYFFFFIVISNNGESHKMSTLKATGIDIVNNEWYWFSSLVIFLAYNSTWWLYFTYLKWICESFRLSVCYLSLCSQPMREPLGPSAGSKSSK